MNVLFIGNHLHESGYTVGVSFEIGYRLRQVGIGAIYTSSKVNKAHRLVDMARTIVHHRKDYNVAQVDVFSGSAFVWALLSVILLKTLKKPIILTLHGGKLPNLGGKYPSLIHWVMNSANFVTVPSKYLFNKMQCYRDDLKLIPNPLDVQAYTFVRRIQPRQTLVWLRSFHKIYNPELAPKVIAGLVKTFPKIQLYMIGPDKGDGSLQRTQQIAHTLGIDSHIHYPGLILKKDVPRWLNKGDVFINTTNVDNTPVSVTEAMACGMCVVSTNVGGIPYLLDDKKDALLVPPNDVNAMVYAVTQILINPDLASNLSLSARVKTEQLDWSVILPKWMDLITSLT